MLRIQNRKSPPGCASHNRMLAAEQTGIDGSDVPIVRWSGFVGLAASPYLVADVASDTTGHHEIVEVHEKRGRPAILRMSERKTAGTLNDMIVENAERFTLPHGSPSRSSLKCIQSTLLEGGWVN